MITTIMKHYINFILLFFVFNSTVNAQWVREDFEFKTSSDQQIKLLKDVSIANRDWQIGRPNKTILSTDSAHNRGFCTDTINPVNPGDTFSAKALFVRTGLDKARLLDLIFSYKFDGDNGDKALAELSIDNGVTWVDLMANDTIYDIVWYPTKPILTGKVEVWSRFSADMRMWVSNELVQKYPVKLRDADSVWFRFTFIAGSSTRPRGGWLIDNLRFQNNLASITNTYAFDQTFSLYPNPASETLSISSVKDAPVSQWQIFNQFGDLVSEGDGAMAQTIDVNHLSNGLYIARILSDGQWYALKFEIAKP